MGLYLLGSEENYNEIRFVNVEDHQNVSQCQVSLIDVIKYPLEYVYGLKSKNDKNFDLSQVCNPLYTVSKRALIHLENILLQHGELLPLKEPFEDFMFFHCTNIIDALIEDKSDISWLDKEKGWIGGINKFVLDKSKIGENQILRLPNANCRYTLFGEEFKEIVIKNKLVGINFNRWEKIEMI